MNTSDLTKENPLKDTVGSFISSYAQRDVTVEFSQWLADRLRQEAPDMSQEASEKLAGEIIGAVADHDKKLYDLNIAVEDGQSKAEWLADQLSEACNGMPLNTVGERLQQVETEFAAFNLRIMEGDRRTQATGVGASISWNEYNVRSKLYGIGDQALLMGQAVVVSALNGKEVEDSSDDKADVVRKALQAALKAVPEEVKAVVAGAIRSAAENGLTDKLPSDTPMGAISDMAGMAVDAAAALLDAINGDITIMEALDRIGRDAVAVGCCAGRYALEGYVLTIPYVGPILVDLLGGLFEHMESSQFHENVYVMIHDAVVATWEGLKESETVKALQQAKEAVLN